MVNIGTNTISDIFIGNTQIKDVYVGEEHVFPQKDKIHYISRLQNVNYEIMYINRNFHFDPTHTYNIKFQVLYAGDYNKPEPQYAYAISIAKYDTSKEWYNNLKPGYNVYKQNSGFFNSYGMGAPKINTTRFNVLTVDTEITGLTNEYYLSLFSTIEVQERCRCSAYIYYITIKDIDTDTVICDLRPIYNETINKTGLKDEVSNTFYYLEEADQNYSRSESDLTIYPNE